VHGCRLLQVLKERIRRQQNRALLTRINAAYADGPDLSEQKLRCKSKLLHRRILDGGMVTETGELE
jgi:hypothetical protein